jgi:hypothetical protein
MNDLRFSPLIPISTIIAPIAVFDTESFDVQITHIQDYNFALYLE